MTVESIQVTRVLETLSSVNHAFKAVLSILKLLPAEIQATTIPIL